MSLPSQESLSAALATLLPLRGVFADGYTDDLVRDVLPPVSTAVGLPLAVVWAFDDCWSLGGDSELLVVEDGRLWELPDGLWEYLTDPTSALGPQTLLAAARGAPRAADPAAIYRDPTNYCWDYCPTEERD